MSDLGAELFEVPVAYASEAFSPDALGRFDEASLPPELARAVPKRRLEFLAGRRCARTALRELAPDLAEAPIAIGERGSPVWPAGLRGSITHTHGFAAAVVVRAETVLGIGLDTERLITSARAEGVAGLVANPRELERLEATGLDRATLLTLVFSAKESLFKCLYPRVGRYFDFKEATVEAVALSSRSFTLVLETELGGLARGARLEGRFAQADDLLHPGITLPERTLARYGVPVRP
jgi:enterobactin synthetase component D